MAQARTPSPRQPRWWLGAGLLLSALLPALAGCDEQPMTPADMGPEDMAMADMSAPDLWEPCSYSFTDLGTPSADMSDKNGFTPVKGACFSMGWCWENPLPQGVELSAVWSLAPDDVWAVGPYGTILHYDGMNWSMVPSGTDSSLNALWGRAANDVWTVGEHGLALHWDGSKWSPVPTGLPGVNLSAIWGLAADDVWVAGDNRLARLSHLDGSGISEYSIDVKYFVTGLWGSSSTDVWAATGGWDSVMRLLWHWDGTSWKQYDPRWDPEACCHLTINAIWGTSASEITAVGTNYDRDFGEFDLHWDGMKWNTDGSFTHIMGLWGSGPGDYWSLEGHDKYSSTGYAVLGKTSLEVDQQEPFYEGLRGLHGSGTNDVWTVSYRPFHWEGDKWSAFGGGLRVSLRNGWAAESGDAWVIGDERWKHAKGTGGHMYLLRRTTDGLWRPVAYPGGAPTAIWGSGANDVWFAGEAGLILHWDGKRWSSYSCPRMTANLNGIFGTSVDNVIAVGDGGSMVRWDGMRWSTLPSLTAKALHAVWGTKADNIWAGGETGTMLHWDGKTWSAVSLPTTNAIIDIRGSGPDDIWAVSDLSMEPKKNLVHWDGTSWKAVDTKTGQYVGAIHGLSKGDVWATSFRAMLHWDGSEWTDVSLAVGLNPEFLFGNTHRIWSTGEYGQILTYPPPP